MSGAAVCNVCKEEGKEPFSVPWSNTPADLPSAAVMQAHLLDAHGIDKELNL